MSAAKHAPGPWRVTSPVDADQLEPTVSDNDDMYIATAHDFADHGVTSLANARLIAAAPELLTALKTLVSVVRVDPADFERLGVVSGANAAIAKAEGR